ncbi:Ig-like domain-containing protein [Candidatus Palauibacter sp.]|uniref:Ig-like domain-containing protein n=1 Tax=Candidatus Palauibacter sp. TaxID=3101350 RepID=UPI003B0188B5
MTLTTPAGPSSVHIRDSGSAAMRIMFRVLTLVTLVLAAGSMAPAWAATDGPAPRPLADTLSVTLAPPEGGSVTEGDTARFTLAVKGKAGSGDVTVRYAVSGTATAGEDYVALSGEMTLSGGARTGTIDLAVVADSVADGGETVTLTLTDGTGPATVVVDATPASVTILDPREPRFNRPPQADAGVDQMVDERTLASLDGSGSSDPDDDPLSFLWTQTAGPDVTLDNDTTQFASFAAPEVHQDSSPAELTFRLRVSDGQYNDYASTTVTVNHVNAPPDCGSLVPPTINRGESGSAACTDPEGAGAVTHRVLEYPSVVRVSVTEDGTAVTWTGVSLGRGPVRVRATDADGEVTDTRFVVTVVNEPPACGSLVPPTINRGDSGSGACTDPDVPNARVTHTATSSNPNVARVSVTEDGTSVAYEGLSLGEATVTVTATDGDDGETEKSFMVRVENEPPDCSGLVGVEVGRRESGSGACTDPDVRNGTVTHRAESSDPSVVRVTGGTSVTWTGESVGEATVDLTATDGDGGVTEKSFAVEVANERPVCTETVQLHRGESRTVDLGSICSDPDGLDPAGFGGGASSDPGIATSTRTGASVRITGVSLGGTTVPVTATDNLGLEGGGNVVVRVVNAPPDCTSLTNVTIHRDASGSAACTDPEGAGAVTHRVLEFPSAVNVTGGAAVTWRGVSLGSGTVRIRAEDADGEVTEKSFAVEVANERPDCTETVQLHRGESRTVDLGSICSDPDGLDPAGFGGGASSAPGIATSTRTGASVRITGVSLGGTTVPVTATDNLGLEGGGNVVVNVVNERPVCTETVQLHRGETTTVDLGSICSDPDGLDPAGFGGGDSSDPGIATSTRTGSSVRITGVSLGGTTVPVSATDNLGLEGGGNIVVNVVNERPDCTETVQLHRGESRTVDLGSICSDPDGLDPTGFGGGDSSDPGIATSTRTGSSVRITGVSLGGTTVPVSATDNLGLEGGGNIVVNVVNERPDCTETVQLHRGESRTVDLGSICSDPDGLDPAGFGGGDSSDPGIARSTRTGSSVRITGVSLGRTTVPVSATDNLGLEGGGNIVVNVVNEPPDCGSLVNVTIHRDASGSGACTDPDVRNGTVTHTATSSDTSVVSVAGGASVRWTGVSLGQVRVTVTARDGDGGVTVKSFVVTVVSPPNQPPVRVGTIPAATVAAGAGGRVDAASYFRDADGDTLSYTASSSDTSRVTVTVSGSEVAFAGVARGSARVTVTASDGHGGTAAQTFAVTVANRAPAAVGTVPAQTVAAGAGGSADVSSYFRDADGDSLSYTAASSDTSRVTVTVSGSEVAFTGVARGSARVTVTASDGHGGTAAQTFAVTVANRAPAAVGAVPAQTVAAGAGGRVDAASYFSDADGDTLSYTAASSDTSRVEVTVSGSEVAFTGVARGSARVRVTASDGYGGTATQTFAVTVEQPNRAPEAEGTIPAATVAVGSSGSVDAGSYFSDPDGDALTYEAESSNTNVVTVSVEGSTVTYTGASAGSAVVTVTASDGHGGTASQAFGVTATVTNPPPVAVGGIAGRWVYRLASDSVDVSSHFSDPEGEALAYAAASSDTAVATAGVRGSVVRFTGRNLGTASVTVTARDPSGGVAEQVFEVEVRNRVPEAVGEIPWDTLAVGESGSVDASRYFMEYDGEFLFYRVSSSAPSVVSARQGRLTTMTYRGEAPGTATVTVTATDGLATARQRFEVTVSNRAPEAVGTIPSQTVAVGAVGSVDVSSHFSDGDGHPLTYAVSWTDSAAVTVREAGGEVTFTGESAGSAAVTVTAADGHGGSAAQTFTVTVTPANRAPAFGAASVERSVAENSPAGTAVGGPVTAADADGDELAYSLVAGSVTSGSFDIEGTTGQLTVGREASLDYEGGTRLLTVGVVASDGTQSDTARVTVAVTDADDPGVVLLDARAARVGVRVSARLADQDDAWNRRRAWQLSADGGGPWTDIVGAASWTYTPVASEVGMWLRAVVTYTDRHGPDKRVESDAVRVTGPNEAPAFGADSVELSVAENSAAGTEVGTVAAADGNDDELLYSFVAGGGGSPLEIEGATGRILVGSGAELNHERDAELRVGVVAGDGMLSDTVAVTILVTDADDPGVVKLDAPVARVGMAISARLADEDGVAAGAAAAGWERSSDGGAAWTEIAGALTDTYVPVSGDAGLLLRAVFAYADGDGPDKRAASVAVRVTDPNVAPEFGAASIELSVAENSAAGAEVGVVTATDGNGDVLSYGFAAGGDAASFEIERSTGRIAVGRSARLDYESGHGTYQARVVASDGMLADTAAVTIAVTNEEEPGSVTLDAGVARVGEALGAVLSDDDRPATGATAASWRTSLDGGVTWTAVAGAASASYAPVAGEEGRLLRAVFAYADGHGPGKRAESGAVPVVGATTPVVSFGAASYPVAMGGSVNVAVMLSPPATEALTIELTARARTGLAMRPVTFEAGDTEQAASVYPQRLPAGDTVTIGFGTLPDGVVAGEPSETAVVVGELGADRPRASRRVPLAVAYGEPSYTVREGAGAEVRLTLSPAADREVVVPLTVTGPGGRAGAAALGVPATARFAPGDTAAAFAVEAPAGARGGPFTLGFGELPEAVSAGPLAASVVEIVASGADAAPPDESLEVGLAVLGRSVAEGARRAVGARMEAAMRGGAGAGGSGSGGGGSPGEWERRAAGMLGALAGGRPDAGAAATPHRRPDAGEALERLLPRVSFSADLGAGRQARLHGSACGGRAPPRGSGASRAASPTRAACGRSPSGPTHSWRTVRASACRSCARAASSTTRTPRSKARSSTA